MSAAPSRTEASIGRARPPPPPPRICPMRCSASACRLRQEAPQRTTAWVSDGVRGEKGPGHLTGRPGERAPDALRGRFGATRADGPRSRGFRGQLHLWNPEFREVFLTSSLRVLQAGQDGDARPSGLHAHSRRCICSASSRAGVAERLLEAPHPARPPHSSSAHPGPDVTSAGTGRDRHVDRA